MKKIIFLLFCLIALNSCSSDDDGGSVSSNQFVGNFSATMDAGIQNGVPVNVNITESNNRFNIRISGTTIEPDIALTGLLVSDVILIDGCTNQCYQGDGNVTDAGVIEIRSGKRFITFGVYFPEDGDTASDAIFFNIEEN